MDFEDELDLDAICDLLEEDNINEVGETNCQSKSPVEHEHTDSNIRKSIEKTNQDENKPIPNINGSQKCKRIVCTDVDLFKTATQRIDDVSMLDTDDAELNPYIEVPELSESGRSIQKSLVEKRFNKYDICSSFASNKRSSSTLELPEKSKDVYGIVETEAFSGIRIIKPLISTAKLKERMVGKKMIKLSSLQNHIRGNEIEGGGDWVTIAVVINKSETKVSKNGKKYLMLKLNDLSDCDRIVSLFLFGQVYNEHWKTAVGSVIGLLNAEIMDGNNNQSSSNELAVTISSPFKLMLIGTSKDFGHCKATKKDGYPCTMVVNKKTCEYCQFHVKSAYKKLSSKRVELQASFSGVEPKSFKSKILKNQQIMYGGQSFTEQPKSIGNSRKLKSKDRAVLGSLAMQKRAGEVVAAEKLRAIENHVNDPNSNKSPSMAATQYTQSSQDSFKQRLNTPSPGSRNLLKHLEKEEKNGLIKTGQFKSISAKDLLAMQKAQSAFPTNRLKNSQNELKPPIVGLGCNPGQDIYLNISKSSCGGNNTGYGFKSMSRTELAKLKAIRKINHSGGGLKKTDPNAVKADTRSKDVQEKIMKRVELASPENVNSPPSKKLCVNPKLEDKKSKLNLERIINMKSSHKNEADTEQAERMDSYFGVLEKKEQMEDKMTSTKEVVIDVVSCKQCNYTANYQSDMCRELRHIVSRHKAKRRFFKCEDCQQRTTTFNKIPNKCCANCGSSNFQRVGMWEEKKAKDSEKLKIRDKDVVAY